MQQLDGYIRSVHEAVRSVMVMVHWRNVSCQIHEDDEEDTQ